LPATSDASRAANEPPAPAWHTGALVALILAVATTGTLLAHRGVQASPATSPPAALPSRQLLGVYLPMLVVQWSLVGYVAVVGRPRNALPSLLGARTRWTSSARAAGDVALAIGCALAIEGIAFVYAKAFGGADAAAVSAMVPRDLQGRLAWIVVAASAGFCEEVVYRGYLQTQLGSFTGRPALGIVIQAALFGAAHADQGLAAVPRVALCGLVLGAVARWRGSLWPGILGHAGLDISGVLLRGA
jgi:membrane protease YdiL (CAAX protease family)